MQTTQTVKRSKMQVSKWGNSLAVRLPVALVEELGLKEGDDVEVVAASEKTLELSHDLRRQEAIERLRKLRRPFPPDFKWNREEANEH